MARNLSANELDDLETIEVELPKNGTPSFPFSYSSHVFYRPDELLCEEGETTIRTEIFKKTLLALFWGQDEQPVPYVFRTADGEVRSMDAGCLGMLSKSVIPSVSFTLDDEGHVVEVSPTEQMCKSYAALRDQLVQKYFGPAT